MEPVAPNVYLGNNMTQGVIDLKETQKIRYCPEKKPAYQVSHDPSEILLIVVWDPHKYITKMACNILNGCHTIDIQNQLLPVLTE